MAGEELDLRVAGVDLRLKLLGEVFLPLVHEMAGQTAYQRTAGGADQHTGPRIAGVDDRAERGSTYGADCNTLPGIGLHDLTKPAGPTGRAASRE
jgi:hypothetical protein